MRCSKTCVEKKLVELTRKMRAGLGVKVSTVISERASGKWPCLAPTKHSRDEVMM